MPSIEIIALPALQDNYIWVIADRVSRQCLIVDPGEAEPVLTFLQQQAWQPVGILLTHHHHDHSGGIPGLLKTFPIPVFGSVLQRVPTINQPLSEGEEVTVLPALPLQVLAIPGHTHDHVAYYSKGRVFCGDTLFTGACGRVFEGTMSQMYHSLQQLAALPADTQVYCGHEYTLANLPFALLIEPDNIQLQQRWQDCQALRQQGLPTVPSTLAVELATNPFLRCEQPSVIATVEQYCGRQLSAPVEVFAELRIWKNNYRAPTN